MKLCNVCWFCINPMVAKMKNVAKKAPGIQFFHFSASTFGQNPVLLMASPSKQEVQDGKPIQWTCCHYIQFSAVIYSLQMISTNMALIVTVIWSKCSYLVTSGRTWLHLSQRRSGDSTIVDFMVNWALWPQIRNLKKRIASLFVLMAPPQLKIFQPQIHHNKRDGKIWRESWLHSD